jgi:hypothetical protein
LEKKRFQIGEENLVLVGERGLEKQKRVAVSSRR